MKRLLPKPLAEICELSALLLSLRVSFWASGLNLLLSVTYGWLLARRRFVGRELLDVLLTLPMVLPPTVLGYYLLMLFGRKGALAVVSQQVVHPRRSKMEVLKPHQLQRTPDEHP